MYSSSNRLVRVAVLLYARSRLGLTRRRSLYFFFESAAIDWPFSADFDGQTQCSLTLGQLSADGDRQIVYLSSQSSIFPVFLLHHQVTLNFVIYLKLDWQEKQRWSTLAVAGCRWLVSMPINGKTVKQWNNRLLLLSPFCPVDYLLNLLFWLQSATCRRRP